MLLDAAAAQLGSSRSVKPILGAVENLRPPQQPGEGSSNDIGRRVSISTAELGMLLVGSIYLAA
jgi:hypothetical protein